MRVGIACYGRSNIDDWRRIGQSRGSGKWTFRLRFDAGSLECQDIRCAEVTPELLGHDIVALGRSPRFKARLISSTHE